MKRRGGQVLSGFVPMGAIPTKMMPDDKPAGPVDTRTPTQKLADLYLAEYEKRQAAYRADEQRKVDEQHQRSLREAAEASRKRARGQFEMNERLIDDCLLRYSQLLTSEEKQAVMQDLLDGDSFTAERCEILCAEAAAQKQAGIDRVRSLCDDSEWQRILDTIARYRSHFTESEILDGTAHRVVYNRFRS